MDFGGFVICNYHYWCFRLSLQYAIAFFSAQHFLSSYHSCCLILCFFFQGYYSHLSCCSSQRRWELMWK